MPTVVTLRPFVKPYRSAGRRPFSNPDELVEACRTYLDGLKAKHPSLAQALEISDSSARLAKVRSCGFDDKRARNIVLANSTVKIRDCEVQARLDEAQAVAAIDAIDAIDDAHEMLRELQHRYGHLKRAQRLDLMTQHYRVLINLAKSYPRREQDALLRVGCDLFVVRIAQMRADVASQ